MISAAVAYSDWESFAAASCCRVAMTETGIVKIWLMAPATAPRRSSALIPGSEHKLYDIDHTYAVLRVTADATIVGYSRLQYAPRTKEYQ